MTERTKPISVLIAEDSRTQREFLLSLLEEAGGFEIVGVAGDGVEVVEETGRLPPGERGEIPAASASPRR